MGARVPWSSGQLRKPRHFLKPPQISSNDFDKSVLDIPMDGLLYQRLFILLTMNNLSGYTIIN